MSLTVDELETMVDALVKARAAGTRAVRFASGSQVTYGTDAEMAAAIARLDRMIADATTGARPMQKLFATSKGFS